MIDKEKIENIKNRWKSMLDQGDIKLEETDIEAPLKVSKAITVTKKGKDFLEGK